MNQPDSHEAVNALLDEMEALLADKTRSLQPFWAAKKRVHTLLATLKPSLKTKGLWQRYKDLADKAQSLASFNGVETEFLIEQIKTCLQDLDADWQNFDELKRRVDTKPLRPFLTGRELSDYRPLYAQMQALKPFVYRLPKLRQELMALNAPFVLKKPHLEALGPLADQAFEKKHALIEEAVALLNLDIATLEAKVKALETSSDSEQGRLCFKLYKSVQMMLGKLSLPGKFYKPFKARLDALWPHLAEAKQKEMAIYEEKKQQRAQEEKRAEEEKAKQEAKKAEKRAAIEANKQAFSKTSEKLQAIIEKGSKLEKEGQSLLAELQSFSLGLLETLKTQELELALQSGLIDSKDVTKEYEERNQLAIKMKRALDTLRKEMASSLVDIEKGLVYQGHRAALTHLLEDELARLATIREEVYE